METGAGQVPAAAAAAARLEPPRAKWVQGEIGLEPLLQQLPAAGTKGLRGGELAWVGGMLFSKNILIAFAP